MVHDGYTKIILARASISSMVRRKERKKDKGKGRDERRKISIEKILRDIRKNCATIRWTLSSLEEERRKTTKVDEQNSIVENDMPSLDIHSSAVNVVDSTIFQALSVTFVFSAILRARCVCVSIYVCVCIDGDVAIDDFLYNRRRKHLF